MLVCIVLAVAMVALTLNRANSWYPTWESLTGPGAVTATRNAGAADPPAAKVTGWQTAEPDVLTADPRTNPAFGQQNWQDPAPRGQYLMVHLVGADSGSAGAVQVWLPPSYLSHPERRYPVIVAFAGVPGSLTTLADGLHIGDEITRLAGERRLRESIVVVPDVFPNDLDTECVDSVNGKVRMTTFVASDVVTWLKTNLRVADGPDGWATLGYSAGGYCAMTFAMRRPDLFSSAISLSGMFVPVFDRNQLGLRGDSSYDLPTVAAQQAPDVRLWFWCAKDDPTPYQSWQSFEARVRAPTSLTTTLIASGGHSITVWQPGVTAGLAWLGQTRSSFAWVAP